MARRSLNEDIAWDDSYAAVVYTLDALQLAGDDGDDEVGALAGRVAPLEQRWGQLDTERRAKQRAIGRAHALVRRRDVQADEAVSELHNDALAEARQDRSAAFFARLFPDPLSVVVRMALESELPVVREIVRRLAEDATPGVLRERHLAPLTVILERGEAALRGREQAFSEAGRTSARIAAWRDDANNVLLGIEGSLTSLAASRKLDKAWVSSFFPSTRARKPKDPEPNAPA